MTLSPYREHTDISTGLPLCTSQPSSDAAAAVRVRRVCPDDIDAVRALHVHLFPVAYPRVFYKKLKVRRSMHVWRV